MIYNEFRKSNSTGGKTECLKGKFMVNSRLFSMWMPIVKAQSADGIAAEKPVPELPINEDIIKKYTPPPGETGWDRIKGMYSTSIYGEFGPEWGAIKHGTTLGLLTGGVYGAIIGGTSARAKYLEKNEGTLYSNEMAARRALQDKISVGMFSGGFRWGWRVAVFTGMYIFTVTHLSVYFNETHASNFVVAGAVSGGLFKFMQGPKAAVTASILGSVLGLCAGVASTAVLRLSGYSLEELRYYHYQVYTLKKSEVDESLLKKLKEEPTTSTKSV